jgi:peptidoglycan/LPS O-acetylase OafA/YrhL
MTRTNQRLPNRRFRRLLPAAVATATLAATITPALGPQPASAAPQARPAPPQSQAVITRGKPRADLAAGHTGATT